METDRHARIKCSNVLHRKQRGPVRGWLGKGVKGVSKVFILIRVQDGSLPLPGVWAAIGNALALDHARCLEKRSRLEQFFQGNVF